jgi:aromatic-amino-acid transaminase
MSAANTSSLFAPIALAPRDPVLGITEAFNADPNPARINLGVGVYVNDEGRVPLLECVRQAETLLLEGKQPLSYLPIDGLPSYDKAASALVFGADSPAVREGRVVAVQALGGTGGLRLGADLLRRFTPAQRLWISDPSWENHRALFEGAGFTVEAYPYIRDRGHALDFGGMIECLSGLPAGDVVVLHACCHNPTGLDLSPEQWTEVIDVVKVRGLIPFLDIAYQGFAEGLDPDAAPVRAFAAAGVPLLVSSSFSKSLSLYGERVGALSVVTSDADEAARVLSQLKRLVRTNYSSPPSHGARIVSAVLGTSELRSLWDEELAGMRNRIRSMREALARKLGSLVDGTDFSFITRQRGMFSYSGLPQPVIARLREEHSIYALDSGRICVAALNSRNIDTVAKAIADCLNTSST